MNTARHIKKLNSLLLAELGENPPYQWIYSDSTEFKRPMRVMDEDGNLRWDYRCPCGLNVHVHSPECLAGLLVVVEPVFMVRKTDPDLTDQWVLCCLQVPMSEYEWRQVFGSTLPYPSNGSWAPVETETHTVAMKPGTLPGEAFTRAIITGRRRSREIKERDIANATNAREEQKDASRLQASRARLKDCLPVNRNPGTRGGDISWGGTDDLSPALRKKIEQGESLVTV